MTSRVIEREETDQLVSEEGSEEVSSDETTVEATGTRGAVKRLLEDPNSSLQAQLTYYFLILLILGSTFAAVVETLPSLKGAAFFFPLEMVVTFLFTVEILLRIWVSNGCWTFFTDGFNIIDMLATFPGYVELAIFVVGVKESDAASADKTAGSMRTLRMMRIVRLVRVVRVLRLAKVARHSSVFNTVLEGIRKSHQGLLVVLFLMSFVMVVSSSLMYLFESEHATKGGNFESIPSSFWWSINALCSMGYGDAIPSTNGGKVIAALTGVVGVVIGAIGIALTSLNFAESHRKNEMASRYQHGGKLAESLHAFEEAAEALAAALPASGPGTMESYAVQSWTQRSRQLVQDANALANAR